MFQGPRTLKASRSSRESWLLVDQKSSCSMLFKRKNKNGCWSTGLSRLRWGTKWIKCYSVYWTQSARNEPERKKPAGTMGTEQRTPLSMGANHHQFPVHTKVSALLRTGLLCKAQSEQVEHQRLVHLHFEVLWYPKSARLMQRTALNRNFKMARWILPVAGLTKLRWSYKRIW